MVRTKVFVGNLSFKTREDELANEFKASGKVVGANIITRGPRSLGYGFVEMESEQDAESAVKLMNKKEIDGRPINVEVAKPREEGEIKPGDDARPRRGRGGFRGGRGRGGFRGARGGRGGFRGRGRGGFRGGRGGRGGGRGGNVAATNVNTTATPGGKKPFYKSEAQQQQNVARTESKTTLFVANLPFGLNDEGFGKVFSEGGLKFKQAHVVVKRNGRSKGFGFVEFDTEVDQQKALAAINKKTVDGRDLIVKVALTEEKKPEEKAEGKAEEKKEEKPVEKKEQPATTPKKEEPKK